MAAKPPHPDPEESHRREALRRAGMRVTGVRLGVLEVLDRGGRALTAQDVADALSARGAKERAGPRGAPDRVTVYRTLNSLVDAGLAHKVDPGDRVFRFSLTDHARCHGGEHRHEHPHFVCDSCGVVECLGDAEVLIRSAAEGAPRRRVKQQDVLLHGTCEKCVDG